MDLEILIDLKKVPVTISDYDIYNLARKIESQNLLPLNTFRKIAHQETIDFIKENMDMEKILMFENGKDNLTYCANSACPQGLFLEFGVFRGNSINQIAKLHPEKTIYGFDSFEGLPEAWSGYSTSGGHFAVVELPEVEKNVTLIKGFFDATLSHFLAANKEDISFMHIDCDLYSSTKTVLECTADRLKKGAVIVFDEYFNYPNWQNHEYKAFKEFCEKRKVSFEYISIGHQQVGVRIK